MPINLNKDSNMTLQGQIQEHMLTKIRQGDWTEGERIPSERELMKLFGVSRNTVRGALKNLTEKGLLGRSSGQGTFIKRSLSLSPLRRTKTGNIGYLLCKKHQHRRLITQEPFYFAVLSKLRDEVSQENYQVLFSYHDSSNTQDLIQLREFLSTVDGLIIEELDSPELLEMIKDARLPTVLLQPHVSIEGWDTISFDLRQGAKTAVEHCFRQGFASIAIINGPLDDDGAQQRFNGYKDGLEALGIPFNKKLCAGGKGWLRDSGLEAAEQLLEQTSSPLAIFCANDALACGVLAIAAKIGKRIPKDLAVIGFDDSILASHATPPLTSIKLDMEQIAIQAARTLLARIANPNLLPTRMILPTSLVQRESTQRNDSKSSASKSNTGCEE